MRYAKLYTACAIGIVVYVCLKGALEWMMP
jgi:hypothetical protein